MTRYNLDQYLRNFALKHINRDHIDLITKSRMSEDVSPATVNRMLAVLRAVLRKAEREWEWIDKAPYVRMLKEPKRRIRWLTKEEAKLLLSILPEHLASMACLSLSTGLRQSNVSGLQWSQVDLQRRHAWIHADQAKAKRSISVPLNDDAVSVIRDQIGRHDQYIFTYHGNPY